MPAYINLPAYLNFIVRRLCSEQQNHLIEPIATTTKATKCNKICNLFNTQPIFLEIIDCISAQTRHQADSLALPIFAPPPLHSCILQATVIRLAPGRLIGRVKSRVFALAFHLLQAFEICMVFIASIVRHIMLSNNGFLRNLLFTSSYF